jgi:hypothetical protein
MIAAHGVDDDGFHDEKRRGALQGAACSVLRDLDDLTAAVLPTVRASPMPLHGLAAVRTGDGLRCRQRIVSAALVALLMRSSSFRYGHSDLRSSAAIDRGELVSV